MSRIKSALEPVANRHYLPERLIYFTVWGIILLFPVVSGLFEYLSGRADAVMWKPVLLMWRDVLPFLFLFEVNNYLLAPFLFLRQRVRGYVVAAVFLSVAVMGGFSYYSDAHPADKAVPVRNEAVHEVPVPFPEVHAPSPEKQVPDSGLQPFLSHTHHAEKNSFPPPPHFDDRLFPRPPVYGPFLARLLIALLMLSFNIAVKQYFKFQRDKEALKELERHNLQSELAYLKYQINPHFFMNTLNNIHALIDIDGEQAKHTLVELSRLMRYVLYETNRPLVSLSREIDFLHLYVELMRIRYTDAVRIEMHFPHSSLDGLQVPPLLFISFVENAFKHGVSYRAASFIHVSLSVAEGRLLFRCINSRHPAGSMTVRGVGLDNITKRLNLLYGNRYSLRIEEETDCYNVSLTIPIN